MSTRADIVSPPPLRTTVARAALLEVGRPEFAALIYANRIGDPSCDGGVYREDRTEADSVLIARAMRLGHLADPDGAEVGCGLTGAPGGSFPSCDGCRGDCDLHEDNRPRPDAGGDR